MQERAKPTYMKVSKEKMAEHREKILKSAAKQFREQGFDNISVAEVMKEAGLTHGGFYGHFTSKQDLAIQAATRAMENSVDKWGKVMATAEGDPVEAFINQYLSPRHRDASGTGCFYAALATDIVRQPSPLKRAATTGLEQFLDLIGRNLPAGSKSNRRQQAIKVFASMLGAMILARTVDDSKLSNEILQTVASTLADKIS
jgi:TetR/AcrR family transcriptional regulator, transcriptional repressor for nem operon